jgi:hypothetical protein
MLEQDWAGAIEPYAGVISFDVASTPSLRAWCLPRGASFARYEALKVAADLAAQRRAVVIHCARVDRRVSGDDRHGVDCHAEGTRSHFRFLWLGGRFVLAGLAQYDGKLAPDLAAKYEKRLRASRTSRNCP